MTEDLDLPAITARYDSHLHECAFLQGCCASNDDIPSLIEEIERLRNLVAELEHALNGASS